MNIYKNWTYNILGDNMPGIRGKKYTNLNFDEKINEEVNEKEYR